MSRKQTKETFGIEIRREFVWCNPWLPGQYLNLFWSGIPLVWKCVTICIGRPASIKTSREQHKKTRDIKTLGPWPVTRKQIRPKLECVHPRSCFRVNQARISVVSESYISDNTRDGGSLESPLLYLLFNNLEITNFGGHTAEQYTIISFCLVLNMHLNMDYNCFLGHFAETWHLFLLKKKKKKKVAFCFILFLETGFPCV